ncbi:hypothetical protein SAMN05428934_101525 [Tessaracoccus flavus]|nr:hypothetical protein SAMN05428934_101525 [Tessaracoccus flavus]
MSFWPTFWLSPDRAWNDVSARTQAKGYSIALRAMLPLRAIRPR